ncbi:MAG: hypothetical protein ACFFDP_07320 [Promethearchaeota archaeon]
MPKETQSWLEKIPPKDRIYYTRLIFAVVAASICLVFNLSGPIGIIGFILGVTIIILSYFITVYLLGVDPEAIGGHGRGIVTGLGTSLFLFLIIWFLIFNFLIAF